MARAEELALAAGDTSSLEDPDSTPEEGVLAFQGETQTLSLVRQVKTSFQENS